MTALRILPRARRDLWSIWHRIAPHNTAAADRVFDLIARKIELLRDHPHLGRERSDVARGARALVVEKWLVFYRVSESQILVVRILDGRRDLARMNLDR